MGLEEKGVESWGVGTKVKERNPYSAYFYF